MESQNTGHADFDLWGQLALNFWAQAINPPQPPTTRFNYRQVPHLVALSLKILNAHESVFTTYLYIRPQPLSQLLVALSGTRYCFNSWKYDLSEYHWSLHFFCSRTMYHQQAHSSGFSVLLLLHAFQRKLLRDRVASIYVWISRETNILQKLRV